MEPSIHQQVGKNLLSIRKARSLSLEQVSELTGVSKAMLGQIERGDSNPTISILWKIVNGLRISFTSLIEEKTQPVTITRVAEIAPFIEAEGAFRSFPLIPYDPLRRFEAYIVEMEPGCAHMSEAHNEGVEEYIYVIRGELHVAIQQGEYAVPTDSALRFYGDVPHTYYNRTQEQTNFYTLIYYPT